MKTKKVLSILNAIKNYILDFYLNHATIFKLIIKYQLERLDKVSNKYSEHSKSVGKIKYLMKQLNTQNQSGKKLLLKE